ncbi:MAG: septal ring lytic transglycosylase RlpA family protein, partial [Gammaproteobacteria bacterium]
MTDPSRNGHKAIKGRAYLFSGIAVAVALFAGCSLFDRESDDVLMPPEVVDVSNVPNAVPVSLPLSKYGNPTSYVVAGKRYYTMPSSMGYKESGIASWYGTESQGKRTSSGESYDNYGMTAAHRTLPLPSFVQVTNKQNGRSVIVKINDRGPFHNNRLIELSYAAAVKLGIVGYGTGLVEVTAINPEDYKTQPQPILREASKELYLQAGEFQVRKNAERLRADIVAKGLGPAGIVEPNVTNDLYVVQVGPFKDAAEAEQAASALQPMGVNATTKYKEDIQGMALDEQPAMRSSTPEPRPAATSRIESEVMETTAATETETAAAKPEVVAMDTDTAELPAETTTSKWKFWKRLPAMPKPAASVPADAAAATTVAAAAGTTNMVTAAAESAPETSEPEVVAMAAETTEPAAEAPTSKWMFWKKRPATIEPEAEMPAETTATLATAAPDSVAETSEPEVVAMAAETTEPTAEA